MLKREIGGFFIAGILAFFVDAGVLQILTHYLGLGPYEARGISFSLAVMTTWILNRTISFQVEKKPSLMELLKYFKSMLLGGVINWIIYSLVIYYSEVARSVPALALIPATVTAMISNFLLMKFWIFNKSTL